MIEDPYQQDDFVSEHGKHTPLSIAALGISLIAVIASVRALLYINYGVETETGAWLYPVSTAVSTVLPFISMGLGGWAISRKGGSTLLAVIAIGISLSILSTVGLGVLISALF